MSHGPTRIASKGACIYCGRSGVPLSDEHIVPKSIGGFHVLEKASCVPCAAVTSKFERDVTRKLWGDARIAHDAPSYRRKERPAAILLSDPAVPGRKVAVPYSDYPAPVVFYKMGQAGLLAGLPQEADVSGTWTLEALSDHERNTQFQQKYGMPLTARFTHVPDSFARMLAKIGYGQILCSLDPTDFMPICLPYILGRAPNLSYVVGGSLLTAPSNEGLGYILETYFVGSLDHALLVAGIRIFANNQSPWYHVVVGEVRGTANLGKVLEKLGKEGITQVPPLSTSVLHHWMPARWPLPPRQQ